MKRKVSDQMKFDNSRRIPIMVLISLALLTVFGKANASHTIAQQTRCKRPELQRAVYEESARPKSKIDYSEAVRFKLGSRKTVYRSGEMITVNLGMLNTSGFPIFIHQLSGPYLTWKIHTEGGQLVAITPHLLVLEGVGAQSYEYLPIDGLGIGSFQLLAGCEVEGITEFKEAHRKLMGEINSGNGRYNKTVFERDLFVTWGDACLSLAAPGTYSITAEMTNEFVVASPCEPFAKTAVGRIESSPLRIVIRE